jgi:hypothetical protein
LGAIEAEVASKEEWSKDDYLQGLRDVWGASLAEAYLEDSDNPEANRVKEELERFQAELNDELEAQREKIRRDLDQKNREDLERRVVDRLLATRADVAWLNEFRKAEVWLATRYLDDHHKRYFESREEVDQLYKPALDTLQEAYQELAVEPLEGKDLGETQISSPSSGSPDEQVTEDSSGLAAATE